MSRARVRTVQVYSRVKVGVKVSDRRDNVVPVTARVSRGAESKSCGGFSLNLGGAFLGVALVLSMSKLLAECTLRSVWLTYVTTGIDGMSAVTAVSAVDMR